MENDCLPKNYRIAPYKLITLGDQPDRNRSALGTVGNGPCKGGNVLCTA